MQGINRESRFVPRKVYVCIETSQSYMPDLRGVEGKQVPV